MQSKRRFGMLVVALLMILMLGLGYYYSAGQKMGESTVVVAVRGYLSVEQKSALNEQFSGYSPENMEGLRLKIFEFPAANAEDSGVNTSEMFGEFMNELKSSESSLILLDRNIYDMVGDETLFEDLSARYLGDPAVSGKYLYAVKDKPFVTAKGLEGLPEMYLVLRSSKSGAVNRNAKTLELYHQQCELLDNIVYSTPPNGFAAQGLQK